MLILLSFFGLPAVVNASQLNCSQTFEIVGETGSAVPAGFERLSHICPILEKLGVETFGSWTGKGGPHRVRFSPIRTRDDHLGGQPSADLFAAFMLQDPSAVFRATSAGGSPE